MRVEGPDFITVRCSDLNRADTTSIWSAAQTLTVSVTYSPANELLQYRLKNHGILRLMEFLAWQAYFFFSAIHVL